MIKQTRIDALQLRHSDLEHQLQKAYNDNDDILVKQLKLKKLNVKQQINDHLFSESE